MTLCTHFLLVTHSVYSTEWKTDIDSCLFSRSSTSIFLPCFYITPILNDLYTFCFACKRTKNLLLFRWTPLRASLYSFSRFFYPIKPVFRKREKPPTRLLLAHIKPEALKIFLSDVSAIRSVSGEIPNRAGWSGSRIW